MEFVGLYVRVLTILIHVVRALTTCPPKFKDKSKVCETHSCFAQSDNLSLYTVGCSAGGLEYWNLFRYSKGLKEEYPISEVGQNLLPSLMGVGLVDSGQLQNNFSHVIPTIIVSFEVPLKSRFKPRAVLLKVSSGHSKYEEDNDQLFESNPMYRLFTFNSSLPRGSENKVIIGYPCIYGLIDCVDSCHQYKVYMLELTTLTWQHPPGITMTYFITSYNCRFSSNTPKLNPRNKWEPLIAVGPNGLTKSVHVVIEQDPFSKDNVYDYSVELMQLGDDDSSNFVAACQIPSFSLNRSCYLQNISVGAYEIRVVGRGLEIYAHPFKIPVPPKIENSFVKGGTQVLEKTPNTTVLNTNEFVLSESFEIKDILIVFFGVLIAVLLLVIIVIGIIKFHKAKCVQLVVLVCCQDHQEACVRVCKQKLEQNGFSEAECKDSKMPAVFSKRFERNSFASRQKKYKIIFQCPKTQKASLQTPSKTFVLNIKIDEISSNDLFWGEKNNLPGQMEEILKRVDPSFCEDLQRYDFNLPLMNTNARDQHDSEYMNHLGPIA